MKQFIETLASDIKTLFPIVVRTTRAPDSTQKANFAADKMTVRTETTLTDLSYFILPTLRRLITNWIDKGWGSGWPT